MFHRSALSALDPFHKQKTSALSESKAAIEVLTSYFTILLIEVKENQTPLSVDCALQALIEVCSNRFHAEQPIVFA